MAEICNVIFLKGTGARPRASDVNRRVRDIAGDTDRDYGIQWAFDVLLGKRGVGGAQQFAKHRGDFQHGATASPEQDTNYLPKTLFPDAPEPNDVCPLGLAV
jgi:hypothetical protein